MNEWMNEWMNERMIDLNEWMSECHGHCVQKEGKRSRETKQKIPYPIA
jgi:endogenous inhibitor of DNA gyrase (YacG/DUF329 family)